MNKSNLLCGITALSALFLASTAVLAADKAPATAEALLYSTMPSTAAHQPDMAMDGDLTSYYKTVYGMGGGDDFLVMLSQPISVQSLRITTGTPEGDDLLTNAYVETSPDGVHYTKAADFDKSGVASASLHNTLVEDVRIKVNSRSSVPSLVIREIALDSKTKISHVQMGPGRGFYDISQAPDLAVWAAKAERQMEEFWPDTEAMLYSYRFIPPNMVNVIYKTGPNVTGVAATGGGVMTVNSKWCREHPDDTGLTVHETSHVIQAYSAYNPVWMVEGIADYIRWVKFEPEHFTVQINPAKATYHDSYRTTAAFLGWCELHYDSGLVTKLSDAVRFGRYNNDLFKTYCGKDVDTLWAEFIAAYKADPVNIITPPIAAGDRPRTLPTVAAGSSTSVDISSQFNTTGIYKDGATFGASDGLDSGGASYSSALLTSPLIWKNVQFNIGPAGAPDAITSAGQVIALPSGNFSSLWLLGTGVEGNQVGQVFTATYADGTTSKLVQNFSDWFQPQDFPGESRALKMPYRLMANGDKDPSPFYLYSYGFSLDSSKQLKSITLPANENVKILAITVAK